MVSMCGMPSLLQVDVHTAEVNWLHLSVVTVACMPKCATQLAMNVSVNVLASMLHSCAASTHLFDLSIAVNRYTWPT